MCGCSRQLAWVGIAVLAGWASAGGVFAQDRPETETFAPVLSEDLSLSLAEAAGGASAGAEASPAPEAPPAETPKGDGPPLPLHSLEGVGGATLVPMAYLVNRGPEGTVFGLPAASYTFLKAGEKMVNAFAVTETFYRRIEFGYGFNHVGLGDWPAAVENATGVDLRHNYVEMHNFNLRGLLVEENTGSPATPAVTGGVHFKYNQGIDSIDHQLGGVAHTLGYERSNGVDYTLTASKTVPKIVFGRPLIATAGLRFSQAAQLGWLGFGDAYRLTWEASAVVPVIDNFCLGYEYRQKKNPYQQLGHLVGDEEDWHAVCFAWILSEHLTFGGVWGHLGNLVNGDENGAWGFQFKYEF